MTQTYSPDERRDRILTLLAEGDRLPVGDLAARFATSEDSIRRDLRRLAADGLIRRVHGAVLPAAPSAPFEARAGAPSPAKAAIAVRAAALFEPGQTVLVDGGTTTLSVIQALPAGLALTVVTTSPPIALALADNPAVAVILVGGSFDRATRTVIGASAVDAVRAVRADVCLIGLCSLDPQSGITATGYEEAQVKRAMLDAAAVVIAVATADKLGTASPHRVDHAGRIDRLVTDTTVPPDLVARFRDAGLDVLLA